MKYEIPELIEIGLAEDIVLGSLKPYVVDGNATGMDQEMFDEDVQ